MRQFLNNQPSPQPSPASGRGSELNNSPLPQGEGKGEGVYCKFIVSLSLVILLAMFFSPQSFANQSEGNAHEVLGGIPVQQGGRVKPFESFAKEIVLYMTGKTHFQKMEPTELVWRWIAAPDIWSAKAILPVSNPELRKDFSADLENNRIAPSLVLADLNFTARTGEVRAKQDRKEKLNEYEKAMIELGSRARLFQAIGRGEMPGFIPHPDDPQAGWVPLEGLASDHGISILETMYPAANVKEASNSLSFLLGRLRDEKIEMAGVSASFFANALTKLLESRDIIIDRTLIHYELFYLKFRPFHTAWAIYLGSLLIWLTLRNKKRANKIAFSFFTAAFAVHTLGFVLRCLIAGRPPVTNMYESVIWVSWSVVLFSLILFAFYRSYLIPMIAASVSILALLISENLPAVLDQSISPLVPVLRSNFWLTVHVLTITLGYGAFLLNWGVAHVVVFHYAFKKKNNKTLDELITFLYRSLQIGLILLAAGTILGGVWANYSWGRFWGWDPKETWALIALLAYLAVMHGRTAGWLDSFATAFWCAVCFLTVIMAWYGVNFVLAAGLHSYGFGGGGVGYVSAVVAADVAFLLLLRSRYHKVRS